MSNQDIGGQVATLLKKCYPNSPDVKGTKITAHKNKLSSFVEDPLLWVKLSNALGSSPSEYDAGAIHPGAAKKRLDLLEDALVKIPNLAELTSGDNYKLKIMDLFSGYLGSTILSSVETIVSTIEPDEDPSPTVSGVVTDLWAVKDGWNGSVTSNPRKKGQMRMPEKGYRFDQTSPAVMDSLGTYPLHIGDEVSFSPLNSDHSVAPGTLHITKYNTCLKDDFVTKYFEWTLSSENRPLECLTKLLGWPAPWTCVLTKEKLYNSYHLQILQVYQICAGASEVNVVPRIKHQLMNTLCESQFILNINRVLAAPLSVQQVDTPEMEQGVKSAIKMKQGLDDGEHAEAENGAPEVEHDTLEREHASPARVGHSDSAEEEEVDYEEKKDEKEDDPLHIAVSLLCAVIEKRKDGSHMLAEPIKEVGRLLCEKREINLMQTLLNSVVDVHMAPSPSSSTTTPHAWHHTPTIPTNEEFQEIINVFQQTKSPRLDLPEVKDTYDSVIEYGHTYFSLLRADCYYPLCEKIARLTCKGKTDDIKDSYYKLTFTKLVPSPPRSVLFGFKFEGVFSQIIEPDDVQTASLTHGNLLCISLDGVFKDDLIWATIERQDDESISIGTDAKGRKIKEGTVYIQLCSDFNTLPDEECMELLTRSKNIVAVESPAYFRAYQPVLDALKGLDLSRLHFLDDFVYPTSIPKSVCDLLKSDVDPEPLYKHGKNDGLGKISVDKMVTNLKMANPSTLRLDPSQMKAVYQSLTMPISLIQGPPGTGKTYVGVKLMQLFLSLGSLPKDKPILIMAFRNRALDQFLKKCLKFCCCAGDVVRIGHCSDGYDELQPFLLHKRVKDMETSGIKKLKDYMQMLSKRIKEASNNIKKKSELTSENCREEISPEWLQSLLLRGPKQWVSGRVAKKVKDNAEDCLNLLKTEAMMGREDSDVYDELSAALQQAWEEWFTDVVREARDGATPSLRSQSNADPDDSNCNGEEMEQERKMAASGCDDEDGVTNYCQIGDVNYLEDADQSVVNAKDVWKLSAVQKKTLVIQAVRKGYAEAIEELKGYLRMYDQTQEKYESAQCRLELNVLRKAKIIGMTTTGAAIRQQLLNELKAPVVFVEEAAEVLESNLLATLTPHVKHLILIGDHMQLKPKVSYNHLAKHKKFDKSLFQRLVESGYPYTLLMNQSRMRPEMVGLYSHQYKEQKRESEGGRIQSNKEIVEGIKQLSCMQTSVFWWSHNQREDSRGSGMVINNHEVKMVVSLCLWILSHGGPDEDEIGEDGIAVLTPYRAQVRALSEGLKNKASSLSRAEVSSKVTKPLSQLSVYTVDEFQGHEAKVVILSLVRSNTKNYIGFLSDKSRQVVAVSRQKRGLYIVGDSKFLKEGSPFVWKPFIENREREGAVSDAIPVQFGNGVSIKSCKTPEDLEKLVTGLQCDVEADGRLAQTKSPVQHQPSLTSPGEPVMSDVPSSPQGCISSAVLSKVVSTEVVLELGETAAVSQWRHIARRLGISDVTITKLASDNPNDLDEVFHQMMITWKGQEGDKATNEKLVKALTKLKLQDVIDTIKPLMT